MNEDIERLLNLRNPPQRLTAEEAAGRLGLSPHEIPILVAKGLLKPLGHPAPNGPKHFLTATLARRDGQTATVPTANPNRRFGKLMGTK
jgi:hypothetical protein